MPRTDEYDYGYESLSPSRRSRYTDPTMVAPMQVLQGDATSGMGVAAKAIAGMMLGRRGSALQDGMVERELASREERQRIADILQKHEEEGLDEEFTFRELLKEHARSGSKTALDIAAKLKPKAAAGPLDQLSKIAKTREAYLRGKFGQRYDDNQVAGLKDDQTLAYLAKQEKQILDSMNAGAPAVGSDAPAPDSFAGIPSAAPQPAGGPGITMPSAGVAPSFLPQDELARQNKMNLGARKNAPASDPLEGRTATSKDGRKIIRRGGKWVPLEKTR